MFNAGGHLAGFIGRSVLANSNKKLIISRITALDPAGPIFYPPSIFITPINKNDGTFVDIIHADANYFGTKYPTGTVDFWPNGAKDQPGCPLLYTDCEFLIKNKFNSILKYFKVFCSHQRSWRFYAESVKSKDKNVFDSIKCNSWNDFVNDKCDKSSKAYMGYGVDSKISGNYYLQTNSASLYSKDQLGTTYTKV